MYIAVEMDHSNEGSASQAYATLPDITNRAEYDYVTTYLTKHGGRVAAVVPADLAEMVEDIEKSR